MRFVFLVLLLSERAFCTTSPVCKTQKTFGSYGTVNICEFTGENGEYGLEISKLSQDYDKGKDEGKIALTDTLTINDVVETLPVLSIADGTFKGWDDITKITIEANVYKLGTNVFEGCECLTEIIFMGNVTEYGTGMFAGCDALVKMVVLGTEQLDSDIDPFDELDSNGVIPVSKITILTGCENRRFFGHNHDRYYVRYLVIETRLEISSTDGKTQSNLAPLEVEDIDTVVIGNGLDCVGKETFKEWTTLKNVTFVQPSAVATIEADAFKGCTELEFLELPSSVTDIGAGACSGSGIKRLVIGGSLTSCGVMFETTDKLSVLVYGGVDSPEDGVKVLPGVSETVLIMSGEVLPDNQKVLGYEFAGYKIMYHAYGEMLSIFPATETIVSAVTLKNGYTSTTFNEVVVNEGLTEIDEAAFKDWTHIWKLTLSNSVTTIGKEAFSGCRSLMYINEEGGVPQTVTKIEGSAFTGLLALKTLKFTEGILTIGEKAFEDAVSLESVTIPESVTSVGDYAFSGARSLTSIIFEGTDTAVGEGAFRDASIVETVKLPGNLGGLDNYLLQGARTLQKLDLPEGLSSIGVSALEGTGALWYVSFPKNLKTIGDSAFQSSGLCSVEFDGSVTSIGESAFNSCRGLVSVTLPGVTSLGSYAFANCQSMTSFSYCSETAIVGENDDPFEECGSLPWIYVPQGYTSEMFANSGKRVLKLLNGSCVIPSEDDEVQGPPAEEEASGMSNGVVAGVSVTIVLIVAVIAVIMLFFLLRGKSTGRGDDEPMIGQDDIPAEPGLEEANEL